MTAMDVQTYDLPRAAALAGDGGAVTRSSIEYAVVTANGEFRLRQEGTSAAQPLGDFVQDGWSVSSTAEPRTVAEFFAALPSGTHVRRQGSADTYVWTGRHVGLLRQPYLISLRYGSDMLLESTDRDNGVFGQPYNVWSAVLDENGQPRVESDLAVRVMARLRNYVENYDRATEENGKLRQDWATLNGKINDYANETNMCSDYERRLESWNEDFQLLELEGRKREFRIPVRVDASYYVTVTVEATNEDAAHDQISDMSTYDVMDNGSWSSPDSVEHEISN